MNDRQWKGMNQWLDNLRYWVDRKSKKELLNLYSINTESDWDWSEAPEYVRDEYDELTEQANEILFGAIN